MATETPGMVCGPTTGCGQTTPMVPTRIHTVNGIEKGWQAPAACSRCGKPFGFFSLINNPPPIAPLSPWFVFASSLGEPVSQEAPIPFSVMPSYVLHCDAQDVGQLAETRFKSRDRISVMLSEDWRRLCSALSGGIPRTENEEPFVIRDIRNQVELNERTGGGFRGEDLVRIGTSMGRELLTYVAKLSTEEKL